MTHASETQPIVDFQNVSIVFGDTPHTALPLMDQGMSRSEIQQQTGQILGVHDCSLSVAQGEILVLMGLSGSGKSTLLRAVNGLNPVVRGKVDIFDGQQMVDVTGADTATLRRLRQHHVAMVFQQFGLLPWRSVRENVGLGLELAGLPKPERDARVQKQLDLVSLSDWADRKVGELSGGMQQRVGLARAFALDAPLLLMDEPFAALDEITRADMRHLLGRLTEPLGTTVVFVTHSIAEAAFLSDRVVVMSPRPGRIVEQIPIDLEHPRRPDIENTAEFFEIATRLRTALQAGSA